MKRLKLKYDLLKTNKENKVNYEFLKEFKLYNLYNIFDKKKNINMSNIRQLDVNYVVNGNIQNKENVLYTLGFKKKYNDWTQVFEGYIYTSGSFQIILPIDNDKYVKSNITNSDNDKSTIKVLKSLLNFKIIQPKKIEKKELK